jgi:Uncharacterized enzymes related to aldose 1-epimerase
VTAQTPGDLVVVRNAGGDEATISLHGAQLLSWKAQGQGEQVYASPLSHPAPAKAVRGGVPICFPQFSDRGTLPRHGFARTRRWELVTLHAPHAPVAEARFQLDSAMTTTRWQHAFCLVLVVRLGPKWLELHLQAANTGRTCFGFTGALHTYLALDDVRQARLHGLQGLAYEDQLHGNAVEAERASALGFSGEIDRVYRQPPAALLLQGGGTERRVVQQGFPDTVVWNPGAAKAAGLGDMPSTDWLRMLCVEAAVVQFPVELTPGKTWRGMQRLELPQAPGFDLSQAE